MSDPFLGQISMVGFNFPPRSWALCDGQLLPINTNQALFSLLGTTFGGDGRTTFGLPELRGRIAMHAGNGPGLSTVQQGQKSGNENVTLVVGNLPAHNHTATLNLGDAADSADVVGNYLNKSTGRTLFGSTTKSTIDDMESGAIDVGNAGSNQSFSVRNPFLGVYHCIALQGVFPSRS